MKVRKCRCYLSDQATYIDSDDATFDTKCQPCGAVGDETTTEECQIGECVDDWDTITTFTKTFHHHMCCAESSAFRV